MATHGGTNDPILNGMASTLWGMEWADHVEEHRCANLSGVEITDVMPEVPIEAYLLAANFIGHIEQANRMNIYALLYKAAKADGQDPYEGDKPGDDYAEEFGSDLGMMALGSGVSWFDDHAQFDIEVPHLEASDLMALAEETCKPQRRRRSSRRGG